MHYYPEKIEKEWQQYWAKNKTFKAEDSSKKPPFYVLDMFPYPSGAGLHVGHPLGYIASDIYARYKRLKGFNVLHPMGYDSFGLPAEQYAIQTGTHPAITTVANINTFRRQMDNIGFSFDWDREVRTSDPSYYKWTQWIFLQLFDACYCKNADKAIPISQLVDEFKTNGNKDVNAHCDETPLFSASDWNSWDEAKQQTILLNYRIAYLSEAYVNWCPQLGTVLANDEVKDGVSERGGYPVERKLMKQWSMRITAYSQRLLDGLEDIDWSESLKEQQRNWIGRSVGAMVRFEVKGQRSEHSGSNLKPQSSNLEIEVFTTRPDTIFGVSFMTLAPEHELVAKITTAEQKAEIEAYIAKAKARSDRERMADVKTISGAFTGAYAEHPFTGAPIPIWIGDYVLAGYGTGAVMAVPSGDQRDWSFAKHFGIPIPAVIEGSDLEKEANESKDGILKNSDFLNGMTVKDAIKAAIAKMEAMKIGEGKINYRQRDAVFGRQRYWGEPIPIYYKDGVPYPINKLPLQLPEVEKYLPTEAGDPPLGNAENWNWNPETEEVVANGEGYPIELSTMPGWAGSSWYYLRYMDPTNDEEFCSKEAMEYWGNVNYYAGGAEHATGHLLYVRFWTKFLKDLGHIPFDEPAKKLVNQGMIQGVSEKVNRWIFELRAGSAPIENLTGFKQEINLVLFESNKDGVKFFPIKPTTTIFSSSDIRIEMNTKVVLKKGSEELVYRPTTVSLNAPISQLASPRLSFDQKCELNVEEYLTWSRDDENAIFICRNGYWQNGKFHYFEQDTTLDKAFYTQPEVEKMSKSKWNVVNPDDIIERYGADTLRLYEMFLGPLEDAKPWNTNGIEGVSRFLKKFWNLFHDGDTFVVSEEEPTKKELKALHATIKKVQEDIERLSFNTSVSQFMICVNELNDLKCNKRAILEPFTVVISTYAPHIAEELWSQLGHSESITFATYPAFNESFLVEDSVNYPISFNGKTRLSIELPASMGKDEVEKVVLANAEVQERLEGAAPKKVIVVPGRIVNIVV
ncbi:MAG: leucine--tRNA ligase [Flavobacteriales bacterium]|nr:leucine--tRNA ligase [Flavobacteriales bacterium]